MQQIAEGAAEERDERDGEGDDDDEEEEEGEDGGGRRARRRGRSGETTPTTPKAGSSSSSSLLPSFYSSEEWLEGYSLSTSEVERLQELGNDYRCAPRWNETTPKREVTLYRMAVASVACTLRVRGICVPLVCSVFFLFLVLFFFVFNRYYFRRFPPYFPPLLFSLLFFFFLSCFSFLFFLRPLRTSYRTR